MFKIAILLASKNEKIVMVLKLYEVINVISTLTYKKCFLLLLSQNDGWEGKMSII